MNESSQTGSKEIKRKFSAPNYKKKERRIQNFFTLTSPSVMPYKRLQDKNGLKLAFFKLLKSTHYQMEHSTSPPTPRNLASRSVTIPKEVERITIPIPPKTFGISL